MKRSWMQAALINFLILVVMAWHASAEPPRLLGEWCWRMWPFADTVLARVYTGETLDGEPHVPLTFNLWILGLNVYSFSGGGTGTMNFSGQMLTLQSLVYNPLPDPYARGNPVVEFKAVMGLDTFVGHYAARSEGAIIYGRPAHEVGGQMHPIDCAEHGQLPSSQVSRSQASSQEWGLALLH
jgi:hypothetical protein